MAPIITPTSPMAPLATTIATRMAPLVTSMARMAPRDLLPLPYLLNIRLLGRDTPDDTTGEVPNPQPEPVPPGYKYPSWAIAVGVLCVIIVCIFFALVCAGLNRRNNRKAALAAEFPCFDSKLPLVCSLATSTSATAAAVAMPFHASEIGTPPLPGPADKLLNLKLPVKLPRVFKKWRRRTEEVQRVVVAGLELKQVEVGKGKMEPRDETARWMKDGDGVWIWERGAGRGPIQSSASIGDTEDVIGFVTEERFEDVDVK